MCQKQSVTTSLCWALHVYRCEQELAEALVSCQKADMFVCTATDSFSNPQKHGSAMKQAWQEAGWRKCWTEVE